MPSGTTHTTLITALQNRRPLQSPSLLASCMYCHDCADRLQITSVCRVLASKGACLVSLEFAMQVVKILSGQLLQQPIPQLNEEIVATQSHHVAVFLGSKAPLAALHRCYSGLYIRPLRTVYSSWPGVGDRSSHHADFTRPVASSQGGMYMQTGRITSLVVLPKKPASDDDKKLTLHKAIKVASAWTGNTTSSTG